MSSRFKGHTNKYYTKQLFWEQLRLLSHEDRDREPLFTLHMDKPGLINFGRVYVECADPSGYKVAKELLDGDFTLWTVLMSCKWFVAAKEIWDRELDAKLYSEGMDEIRELAKTGMPAQRLAAAKFLANKEYRKDKSLNKGRPRREDVDRAARDLAESEQAVNDDLNRIRGIIGASK